METANFGTFLREERKRRQVSLTELSHSTKLSVSSLKLIEAGNLDDLPPDVFVRGFIRAYAKRLGISSTEPLGLLDQVLNERRHASLPPVVLESRYEPQPAREPSMPIYPQVEDEVLPPRRGIGLAVFVIIVLLIATITLSLFLRQQPPSGEGLSLEEGATSPLSASRSG
jgi:cytoskeletal protein RodZ